MGQDRETKAKKRSQKQREERLKREALKAAGKRRTLKNELGQSLERQDEKLNALAATIKTLWENQLSLQASIDLVEEEFCVLGRILIPKVNDILLATGDEDLITEESINETFKVWHAFKKRSDFKGHFVPWFLGRALKDLPPESVAKEGVLNDTPDDVVEGAIEFGGDYAQGQDSSIGDPSDRQVESQSSEDRSETAVPQGQDTDGPVPGDGRETGAALP